jgi:sec-independent protein translocase protein TatA
MDIGAPELIIVLIIVLLVFGPGRIVKVARELGTGIRQFRQGLETPSEPDKSEEEKPSGA